MISWVSIKIENNYKNEICDYCKDVIKAGDKIKKVEVQYSGLGRGDDDVIFLHKNCSKQLNGENHIHYAERLLNLNK